MLDTNPSLLLICDHDDSLTNIAIEEMMRNMTDEEMQKKISNDKVFKKLSNPEVLKQLSVGVMRSKRSKEKTVRKLSKGETPRKVSKAETLKTLSKGETLRKLSKGETTRKLSKGETLKKLSRGTTLFSGVRPCGCKRNETNIIEISAYNTNLVSRSLCSLPSDVSYMSCRNCSPDSSESVLSVSSEDSESPIRNISVEVGSESELVQDIGFNSGIYGSINDLHDSGDIHVARVDSLVKESKDLKIYRCEN